MFNKNIRKNYKNKIISSLVLALVFILILSLLVSSRVNYNNIYYRIEVLDTATNNNQPGDINNKTQNTQNPLVQSPEVDLSNYENTVLYLINTVRVSNGLNVLMPNQILIDISRSRSTDMINRDYFAHYTPDGKNILDILKECGVKYRNAGENLAQSMPADYGDPEAFMDAWMKSPSHAANILRECYEMIGIGVSDNGDRRVLTIVLINKRIQKPGYRIDE
jgi:uncharacterized protein YkwD